MKKEDMPHGEAHDIIDSLLSVERGVVLSEEEACGHFRTRAIAVASKNPDVSFRRETILPEDLKIQGNS